MDKKSFQENYKGENAGQVNISQVMDLIKTEIERRKAFDADLKKMGAELSALNCISLSKDNYYNLMLSPNAKLVKFEENEVQEVKVVNYNGTEYWITKEFEKNETT